MIKLPQKKIKYIFIFFSLVIVFEIAIFLLIKKPTDQTLNKIINYNFCDRFQEWGSIQQCWEKLIESTLENNGLGAAFKLVDHLYSREPRFASDCHGFTHLLGEKAYKLFSQKQAIPLSSKTSYCGFGFYHAFMESLLRSTADLNQARSFCDYVGRQSSQNELSRLSCFHGIGHGLLEDILNPVLKGDTQAIIKQPLEICTKVSKTDIEEYRCASGVFNVLALYYQNPETGLKVQKNDPYLICHSQTKKYPKKSCYDQMNSLVLSLNQGNLLSAAKFAEEITDDEFAGEAIHGISGAYGQTNVAKVNYDDVIKTCQSIQVRLSSQCLEGFLLGLLEGGKPGMEYIEGKKFCDSKFLNRAEKNACLNALVWNVSVFNPTQLDELCSNLDPEYKKDCKIN